jgi:hypothetical protein
LYVARFIWWTLPLRCLAALPGGVELLRHAYRWIAARRHCIGGSCEIERPAPKTAWLPLVILPAAAAALTTRMPAWGTMWALACAIFVGCKWLSWQECAGSYPPARLGRRLAYLLLWAGMDPAPFLQEKERGIIRPRAGEWAAAALKTALGAALLWGFARTVPASHPLAAGWIGMAGIIFLLHFGTFHLLALFWRARGVPVEPIMQMPVAARSLAEFWSTRWNRGFNDLAHRHLFKPLEKKLGVPAALLLTFGASGLVHDLVISAPARSGFGLPTLYFLIQGLGVLAERSAAGRRIGLRRGVHGRLFALAVAAGPAFWLFHPPFVGRVIIPFLQEVHSL